MADRIRMQTEQLEELSSQMAGLSSALSVIEDRIRSVDIDRISGSEVKVRMPSGVLSSIDCRLRSGETKECLSNLSSVVAEMGRYTHAVAAGMGMVAGVFEDTEKELVSRFGGLKSGENGLFQSVCGILNLSTDRSQWSAKMQNDFHQLIDSGQLVVDGGMAMLAYGGVNYLLDSQGILATYEEQRGWSSIKTTTRLYSNGGMAELETTAGLQEAKTKIKLAEGDKLLESKTSYDRNGNEITQEKDEKKPGQKVKVLSAGVSAAESISAWYAEGAAEWGGIEAEGSIGVANGEMHGSITGGFGVYLPGENGEQKLYLGVEVESGASVSALEIKGSAEYELWDAFEVNAKGDVSVLTADVSASAGLGIIGGELVAYAKAGAEANLAEISGEVGVDVGGVKGSVGASAKIGIGATAEVGYKDGVITLDAGLAVGLGVSVNIELDVSGAVDNFVSFAEDVGEAVQSISDGIASICAWFQ